MNSRNIILTPFELTALSFGPQAVFLPIPVGSIWREAPRGDRSVLKVGVLSGPRARAEAQAVDELARLGPNVTVDNIAAGDPLAAQDFDVIVDTLSEDALSVEGLYAMASGAVVIVGARSESSRAVVAERPLLYVSAQVLPDAIAELSSERDDLRRIRMDLTAYLERAHSPHRAEEVIDSLLA